VEAREKELENEKQEGETVVEAPVRMNRTKGKDFKEENYVRNEGEHSRGDMTAVEEPKFRGDIQTYVCELME